MTRAFTNAALGRKHSVCMCLNEYLPMAPLSNVTLSSPPSPKICRNHAHSPNLLLRDLSIVELKPYLSDG